MPTPVGDITAALADDDDLRLVAAVTRLTMATVLRKCREAHGNMLLRNVFDERWPIEAEDLENCTVALARDAGLGLEIADATGLSERTVTKRLRDEPGNMLVGNAFPELYEDEDDFSGADDDEEEIDQQAEDAAALSDVQADWSRPRKITRVMTALGFDVGERLRTERFQEVVRAVRVAGVEMCLADDDEVLGNYAQSPGINAKVRLRRIGKSQGDERRTAQASVHTTVVVTPSTSPHLQEVPGQVSASSYELALMRLELLTAVPSLDREHSPLWPHAFLEAASRGLTLEPHQRAILGVVAQNFRRGFHDAIHIAAALRPRLAGTEWEALLADFVRLNPDSAPAVRVVLDHLGARASAPEAPVPVQALVIAPNMPSVATAPTAGLPRAAAAAGAVGEQTDGRDLGALEGIFD